MDSRRLLATLFWLPRGLSVWWMVAWILMPATACGDFALYTIPGSDLTLRLDGNVKVNTGGTVTLRHPRGTLYFNARDVRILRSPARETVLGRRLTEASRSQDVDQMLDLARWALHNGMLDKCKSLLGDAWRVDSSHAQLRKIAGLMQYINRAVPQSASEENHARQLVGLPDMTVSRSKHFLLLHDGDTYQDPVTKMTRAEMRLKLLEKVYESYFLAFAFEGVFLRPPTETLQVVLFGEHKDFLMMERRFEMGPLRQVAGFYLPDKNISVFYDSGTTPEFKELQKLSEHLESVKQEMKRTRQPGGGEVIRYANTVQLLLDIQRESEDVSTVSHEAVHHLAANTGLFPRDGVFVRWVHEGLASFFESDKLARWSGVGVVDEDRIGYYRILEGDPIRGSLEFIVSDLGFAVEGLLGSQLPAYGQAWALTHFLFHQRFDQLMQYYRRLQDMPEDIDPQQRPKKLLEMFDEAFGDRVALELQWRRYMRTLKTDIDRLAEEMR